MGHSEQVEFIAVLETISVVLQGVCTVGFISVPSLFYIAAEDRMSRNDDIEEVHSRVTNFLVFFDLLLLFLFLGQIYVLLTLKDGLNEKNPVKLLPWLIYNLFFYGLIMIGSICGIIFLTWMCWLHGANLIFLLYRGWTLIQVLCYYRELKKVLPVNTDKNHIEIYV